MSGYLAAAGGVAGSGLSAAAGGGGGGGAESDSTRASCAERRRGVRRASGAAWRRKAGAGGGDLLEARGVGLGVLLHQRADRRRHRLALRRQFRRRVGSGDGVQQLKVGLRMLVRRGTRVSSGRPHLPRRLPVQEPRERALRRRSTAVQGQANGQGWDQS